VSDPHHEQRCRKEKKLGRKCADKAPGDLLDHDVADLDDWPVAAQGLIGDERGHRVDEDHQEQCSDTIDDAAQGGGGAGEVRGQRAGIQSGLE
jgi:hypothetical protein